MLVVFLALPDLLRFGFSVDAPKGGNSFALSNVGKSSPLFVSGVVVLELTIYGDDAVGGGDDII